MNDTLIQRITADLRASDSDLCAEAVIVIEHLTHMVEEYEDEIYFKTLTQRALEDELGLPHL